MNYLIRLIVRVGNPICLVLTYAFVLSVFICFFISIKIGYENILNGIYLFGFASFLPVLIAVLPLVYVVFRQHIKKYKKSKE